MVLRDTCGIIVIATVLHDLHIDYIYDDHASGYFEFAVSSMPMS